MYETSIPLALVFYKLKSNLYFWLGIVLKLLFIIFLLPEIHLDYFLPFVESFLRNPSYDPWGSFLSSEGDKNAFPYGPIMLLVHSVPAGIGLLIDNAFNSDFFFGFGFRFSLLLSDLMLLVTLVKYSNLDFKNLIIYYWLSPLVIFILYWHGQTDVVPIMFLLGSLFLLARRKLILGGIALALAVAAKHTVLLGVPIIFLYLFLKKSLTNQFQYYFLSFLLGIVLFEVPLLFSDGFNEMVLQNREVAKLFWLSFSLGSFEVYLIPLAYIFLCFYIWSLRRIDFNLLISALNLVFLILVMFSPAPPGWYMWMIPFICLYIPNARFQAYIFYMFSILFVSLSIITVPGPSNLMLSGNLDFSEDSYLRVLNLLNTLSISLLALLVISIFKDGVTKNIYFILGKQPFAFGIAGDSGTGKSTLDNAITSLFGRNHVLNLEGDNYHLYDRYSLEWKYRTHLDPRANNLYQMSDDLRKLKNRESINQKKYDHSSGLFSSMQKIFSKDFITINGLHVLHSEKMNKLIDLKIYLEMDESLRQSLKLNRDVIERGKDKDTTLKEIERRIPDYQKFVSLQKGKADIVFSIIPSSNDQVSEISSQNSRLRVSIRDGNIYQELISILTGLLGLHVEIEDLKGDGEVTFDIQGEVRSEDIYLAVHKIANELLELIDYESGIKNGYLGLMQLIIILLLKETIKYKIY